MESNISDIYSEIYGILEFLGENYKKRLPSKLFKKILEEKNPQYNPNYNMTNNMNFKKETKAIIALFKINYWCESETEKQELIKRFRDNEQKYQKILQEKYDINNIFEKRKNKKSEETTKVEKSLITYKKNLIFQIFKKIKNILFNFFSKSN